MHSRYTKRIAEEYPHDLKSYHEAEEAASLYRRILASRPDDSVVIVTVGHLTNLKSLLLSKADVHSPLDGVELVRKKARLWSCMGGRYPKGKEPNFYRPDPGSSEVCVRLWPKKAVFSGAEIGAAIKTGGRAFSDKASAGSPVRRAYQLYNRFEGRSSWDQTAVIYAVRGNYNNWWSISSAGRNHVFPDGSNQWQDCPDADHAYLIQKAAPEEIAGFLDELMAEEPAIDAGD